MSNSGSQHSGGAVSARPANGAAMELHYHLLDVFTDVPFGGNQLAVFVDAPVLEPGLMQRIARELNLSETVFVQPPRDRTAVRAIRIFTPGVELPFAGHPTIGTAYLLIALGLVSAAQAERGFLLEEEVGLVAVTVRARPDGTRVAELTPAQLPETRDSVPARAGLAALLGIEIEDIVDEPDGDAPQAVSAGVPFLFVPVRNRGVLARVAVDLARWRELLASAWAPHLYVFCRDAERGADIRARMFAPAMNISEDPATGGAAAAFAGYLAWRVADRDAELRWVVEQGVEMQRPSRLELTALKEAGIVRSVRVGGTAVRIGEGVLRI
jgi:trans-2,3-dihydro-3-hydroxyanthranilate isomerase